MQRILRFFCLAAFFAFAIAGNAAGQVVANFSATPTSGCTPVTVSFTNLSTGGADYFMWTISGPGTPLTTNIPNPSYTFTTPGTYDVTLLAVNTSTNDTDVKTTLQYLNFGSAPVISFYSPDTALACAPRVANFYSNVILNSAGTASYLWDFGDTSTSTLSTNPVTHTYQQAGNYNVSLTVTNGAGCVSSFTRANFIHVNGGPNLNFTSGNNVSCGLPATVTFEFAPQPNFTYKWNFGDGTGYHTFNTSPVNWTYGAGVSPGPKNVQLVAIPTASGYCGDTLLKPNFVYVGQLTGSFTSSADSICSGGTVTVTNTSSNATGSSASVVWYADGNAVPFSTTSPAQVSFTTPGVHTVSLVVSAQNCTDTVVKNITVPAQPIVTITANSYYNCSAPFTVSFPVTSNAPAGSTYTYDFNGDLTTDATVAGTATQSYTFGMAGTYTPTVTVTTPLGCSFTYTIAQPIIISPPAATITATPAQGCAPLNACFSAATTTGTIAGYSWNFGDPGPGNTSTLATPCHTYATLGNNSYTVTLTYSLGAGCSGTATKVIKTGTSPVASFTIAGPTPITTPLDTVCQGTTVTFNNTSTGTIPTSTFNWYYLGNAALLGNATNTTGSYQYNSLGTFWVTLLAANNGCVDTSTRAPTIVVKGAAPNFTQTYSCADRKTWTFTSSSTGVDPGTIYTWDFGDLTAPVTTSTLSVNHTYAAYGTYIVTLTVNDVTEGCISTKSTTIIVQPINSSFTYSSGTVCVGSPINFSASNQVTGTYTFNWGDNTTDQYTGTIYNTTHIYSAPGIYTVKLIFKDAKNCMDSTTHSVTVTGPIVAFNANDTFACPSQTINFTSTSSSTPGLSTIVWYFGDGQTATGAAVSHAYANPGSYDVQLLVTDNAGCKDSLLKPGFITVQAPPQAYFYTNDTVVCPGAPITFNNVTSLDTPNTYTYLWNFGDTGPGNTSTAVNPTHAYANPGNYSVTLTVTNSNGCSGSITRTSYIHILDIQAEFIMDDDSATCPPFTVNFTNQSQQASQYLWDFDNGSFASIANPSATFLTSGTFDVKLIAISSLGCKDSITHPVYVGGPTGTFSYTPLTGCAPMSVQLCVNNTNASVITFDTRDFVTTQQTLAPGASSVCINHYYPLPGVYVPIITLSDGQSCNYTVIGADTIKIDRPNGGFWYSQDSVCPYVPITFHDTSTSFLNAIAGRIWYFDYPNNGPGLTATTVNPVHSYPAGGSYNVLLVDNTAFGCTDSMFKTVHIRQQPDILINPSVASVCNGDSVQLQVVNNNALTTIATYDWNHGNYLSDSTVFNPFAFPPAATTFTVIVTATNGCTDTATRLVSVDTIPVIYITGDSIICQNSCTFLTANGAGTGSYTWTGTGLSCTNCTMPNACPPGASNAVYTVTGTTPAGCFSSDTFTVHLDIPVADFTISMDTACQYVPITYTDASTPGVAALTGHAWYPDYTANPSATASGTSTTYTYTTPGVHTVLYVVNSTEGCNDSVTKTIFIKTNPVVSISPNPAAVCFGNPVQLHVTGTGLGATTTYDFNHGNTLSDSTIADPIATPTVPTPYTVIVTAANGCADTANLTVNVDTIPLITITGDSTLCKSTCTLLTASGAGSGTYSWTGPGLACDTCAVTNACPPGSADAVYTVTGTTPAGCHNTDTFTIYLDAPIADFTKSTDTACQYQPITYTDASTQDVTPITTQFWYPDYAAGNPGPSLSGATVSYAYPSPGVRTVLHVIFSSGGCTDSVTKTVFIKTNPVISIAPANPSVCPGDSVQLIATGSGLGTTPQFSWNNPATLSNPNIYNPYAFPLTPTNYTVIATATNGCSDTASRTVGINPIPVITITGDTTICYGQSTILTANGAGTNGNYVWQGPAINGSNTQPSVNVSPTSNAIYTVTGFTQFGCHSSKSTTVIVTPLPVIVAPDPGPICRGDTAQLYANDANDSIVTAFTWTPPGPGTISCMACDSPLAYPTVTSDYLVTATVNGCSTFDTVTVTVNQLPNVSAGPDKEICLGDSVRLTASGAVSYFWTPSPVSSPHSASTYVNPAITTIYTVTGTDANGCVNKDQTTVTVIQHVPTSVGPDEIICHGDSVQLHAYGGQAYTWMPPEGLSDPTSADPFASPDSTTTYTVYIRENQCFSDTFSVLVTVNPRPLPVLMNDVVIFGGESVQINGNYTNTTTYAWSPSETLSCSDCPYPVATPTTTTTYVVTAGNQYGCYNTDTVVVFVKCDSLIFLPNTFTPNKDGVNDVFYPHARGAVTIKMFRVFSRWGEVIFEQSGVLASNPAYGWDGTFHEQPLKPDVYVYTIDFICQDGTTQHKQGDISLIR